MARRFTPEQRRQILDEADELLRESDGEGRSNRGDVTRRLSSRISPRTLRRWRSWDKDGDRSRVADRASSGDSSSEGDSTSDGDSSGAGD